MIPGRSGVVAVEPWLCETQRRLSRAGRGRAPREVQQEVPQVQYIDRIVDVPVLMQRQVPTIQTVQKTVEVIQLVPQERIQE